MVSYVVSSYFVVCYWVLSGKTVGTSITSHAFFFFFFWILYLFRKCEFIFLEDNFKEITQIVLTFVIFGE